MNICELGVFRVANNQGDGLTALIIYYAFALIAAYSTLALTLTNTTIKTKWWLYPLGTVFLFVEAVLLTPGAAIAGAQSIGYSITRISGPFYIVIQLGLLVPLVTMVCVLGFTILTSKQRSARTLAKTYMFAFAPMATIAILVVLLMALGFKINASGFISVTVCLTIWILFFTSTEKNQYVFLSFIPKTRENKSVYTIATNLACPENGLKQALLELESRIIEETLAKTSGNITHASEILGIARSTLSQKVAKLGLGGNA
ncbi:helix-turn-helix domain-containing protein [Teredinibacter haidensis]|uniref:helix-turn-helix domain-containing protein n=1 Tax=Teredinibacter haidensis TaxID=2731755 RepID=UPI00111531DF|nr:helix-turn-helix domain-containing protein [Teredinibacter haidensis]